MFRRWSDLAWLGLLAFGNGVHAIGQSTCVSFTPSASSFPIVRNRLATPILLSEDEWGGVQRAASDFAMDIHNVTGVMPGLFNVTASTASANLGSGGARAIIVGTLGQSSLIDAIVNHANLDVSSVEGQWEAFMTKEVANPLPGISSAYVMIGADKRGTIYALYDHSEQFGTWTTLRVRSLSLYSEHFLSMKVSHHGTGTYAQI